MSRPLPDCIQAADLELYICDEESLLASKTIGYHYYYSCTSEDEVIDPRFLVRPSAPAFGRYADDDGDEDVECQLWSKDDYGAANSGIWLDDVPFSNGDDYKAPIKHQMENGNENAEDKIRELSSLDPEGIQDSGSEDGEGDKLYEAISFGRNRVEMSFIAYRSGWDDDYDYIMRGMAGTFYCPPPRSLSYRISRIHYDSKSYRASQRNSNRKQHTRIPPSSRPRNSGLATPLRVRLLSASVQNRALATRKSLFQHSELSGTQCLSIRQEDKTSHQSSEVLNAWELRVIESLYELEKI